MARDTRINKQNIKYPFARKRGVLFRAKTNDLIIKILFVKSLYTAFDVPKFPFNTPAFFLDFLKTDIAKHTAAPSHKKCQNSSLDFPLYVWQLLTFF